MTLCSTRSTDGGKTWSKLKPIELPETDDDCKYYGVGNHGGGKCYISSSKIAYSTAVSERKQSHDGYQLLVGDRIYLFYGRNCGRQPPKGNTYSRTDMQLEEGFWMRWSDDYGETFNGGRVVIPVIIPKVGML